MPEAGPHDLWFAENLQPHEAMLRAWLRGRFSGENDVDDVIQEAYMRVLRARERGEVRAPKAFLFATARNVAVDRLRRNRFASANVLPEDDLLADMEDGGSVPEAVSRSEELELLTKAIQSLPERCRQVLTLRKIYGLSQKQIAAQLGIAEHTVESHGAIGMRKCAEYFARHERGLHAS